MSNPFATFKSISHDLPECFHMASQVTGACCDIGWYLHLDAGDRERDSAGIMPLRMTIDGWQSVSRQRRCKGLYRERCQKDPGKIRQSSQKVFKVKREEETNWRGSTNVL